MDLTVENLGKKYNREWIFRHLDFQIVSGDKVAITGVNGSGKSTLINILSNFLTPTEGRVSYTNPSPDENPQLKFAFAAPYVNLIEEFTLLEFLTFHSRFKQTDLSPIEIIEDCMLVQAKDRLISEFSSGMKQRIRLALAFFFDAEIIFFDEPTTNLDNQGVQWYTKLVQEKLKNTTVIIASNQLIEYNYCSRMIPIENFKINT